MAMFDDNTEGAVISQLLNFPQAWDSVGDKLGAELFMDDTCRKIFVAIKSLNDRGRDAEIVDVVQLLGDSIDMDEFMALKEFYDHSPASIGRSVKVLQELSMSRRLHKASHAIAALAQDKEQGDIATRLEMAKTCLDELEFSGEDLDYKDAMTIAMEHREVLEARDKGRSVVYPTGFFDLDELLGGGLEPGKFMILGARPSMGKSAIALNIALNMASHHATAFMSMEMPYSDVADRQFAILGGAKMQHLRQPKKGLEWERVVEASDKAQSLQFFVSDKTSLTINHVRSFARRMKRKHNLAVLIVDYIGLMKGTNLRLEKRFQIEEITQGLKNLAKELNIGVIGLAQLNRDADASAFDIPGMRHLADSASMERDADIIGFLHRPIVINPDLGEQFKNFAVLRLSKNRQGIPGDVNFFYQGEVMGFQNWGGDSPIKQARQTKTRGMGL